MYSFHTKCIWLALVVLVASCGDAPEARFGFNVSGIQFEFFDETEGVHPSKVTLANPRNPFRDLGISDDTRFDILGGGGNAGAFYALATVLARIPIGENQFFTASKLRDIYRSNEVAEEDRETVRQMAINGFQAILDCFPESVLFEPTGTFARPLSTLAFNEIIALGGDPLGDWFLVQDSNGNPMAVQSSGLPGGREVECE